MSTITGLSARRIGDSRSRRTECRSPGNLAIVQVPKNRKADRADFDEHNNTRSSFPGDVLGCHRGRCPLGARRSICGRWRPSFGVRRDFICGRRNGGRRSCDGQFAPDTHRSTHTRPDCRSRPTLGINLVWNHDPAAWMGHTSAARRRNRGLRDFGRLDSIAHECAAPPESGACHNRRTAGLDQGS